MQLVDNETFLTKVSTLFQSTTSSGSIWLTHKRLLHEGGDSHISSEVDRVKEFPCLVRVTDGNETKFSTVVQPAELEKFHAAYGNILKSSMTTLRKRDKKREKQRAEDAARKKRRLQEDIAIEGPKRGAGRRKRQRKVKAALQLEEAKKRAQEREEAKARTKSS
ncbi:signal recognition particle, SRP9/SRP14 subunit [Fomes fomentarius]|nr:signal recognition particle, SRP9/SRP14 subunit [Fomes fomentarius]